MSFDIDEKEFYETFAELQESEGSQRALEWAWSALDWTQQELRKERADAVAYLRKGEGGEQGRVEYADDIERGEHRTKEER